jgi:hypothetical protein
MALTPEARARAKKRKEARDKLTPEERKAKDSKAHPATQKLRKAFEDNPMPEFDTSTLEAPKKKSGSKKAKKKSGSKKAKSNIKALRKGLKEDGLKERKRPGGRGR